MKPFCLQRLRLKATDNVDEIPKLSKSRSGTIQFARKDIINLGKNILLSGRADKRIHILFQGIRPKLNSVALFPIN